MNWPDVQLAHLLTPVHNEIRVKGAVYGLERKEGRKSKINMLNNHVLLLELMEAC